jgi:hypothetical protein
MRQRKRELCEQTGHAIMEEVFSERSVLQQYNEDQTLAAWRRVKILPP